MELIDKKEDVVSKLVLDLRQTNADLPKNVAREYDLKKGFHDVENYKHTEEKEHTSFKSAAIAVQASNEFARGGKRHRESIDNTDGVSSPSASKKSKTDNDE